ncbi:MAG: beta-lactamase family protein [Alphaproteobacteria bacterium]|nr:beta-lactamase family protein [Alphaproteobacteria bacterium]MBU2379370.1 beta-lactamase family protein [Alphaproteobacteria bacterium]
MQIKAPEKHGFDPARLQRLDGFIKARYLDTGKLPHAQILISRDNEIVHFSSQGAAREGSDKPVDEGSIFRIASMTKPITSVAFMMLVEQGKVAVDTPVHDILPEFKNTGVYSGGGGGVPFITKPTAQPMRMLDLLRHTSGLTYGFQYRSNIDAVYRATPSDAGPVENWYGEADLDTFITELAKTPLEFSPGEAWNYSVSTDVLGAVVQRVSGMPLDHFIAAKILTPLKMHDTGFMVPADKAERLVDCYAWAGPSGRIMYDRGETSMWLKQPKLVSGGGGLVSTALDYHRFCLMLANGGELDGVRILGRKTVELMTMNHLPGKSDLSTLSQSLFSETQNGGVGFGLGVAVTQDVAKAMIPGSAGEYYWGGMFSTSFFIDPVEKLHVVFMTQLSPSLLYPIRRELKTLIYSALT